MNKKLTVITILGGFIILLVTMALAPPAMADDGWWNSNQYYDWSNTSYWAWGSKPGPTNVAFIGYAGYANPANVTISSPQAVGDIFLGFSGGSYQGNINMTGGSLAVTTDILLGVYGRGTFTQNAGTVTVPTVYFGYYSGAAGTYNLNGGTLSVASFQPHAAGATSTFNVNGVTTSGTIDGAWTTLPVDNFNVGSSGSFTLANGKTLQATSVTTAGTLAINGNASGNTLDVLNGGTLQGVGHVAYNTVNIQTGGKLAPGNSIGDIYIDGALDCNECTIDIEYGAGGTYDRIFANSADLTNVTFNFIQTAGAELPSNFNFLFTDTGITVNGVTVNGADGYAFQINGNNGGLAPNAPPVPEIPAGVALPLLALLGSAMVLLKKKFFGVK